MIDLAPSPGQLSFSDILIHQNKSEIACCPLKGKLAKLYQVMRSGNWYSPMDLCSLTGISPFSITARLRDLRKREYGQHEIVNVEDAAGTRYRLVPPSL